MDPDITQDFKDKNIWEQKDLIDRVVHPIHFKKENSIRYAQKSSNTDDFSKKLLAVQQGKAFILQVDYLHGPTSEGHELTDGFYVDQIKSLSKYVGLMLGKPVIPLRFSEKTFPAHDEPLNDQNCISATNRIVSWDKLISPVVRQRSQRLTNADKVIIHTDTDHELSDSNVIQLDGTELILNDFHLKLIESSSPMWVGINGHLTAEEVLTIYNHLNPRKEEGKIVFSTSFGKDVSLLKDFINTLQEVGAPVIWLCDPLGAHVDKQAGPVSIATLEEIIHELDASAKAHTAMGSHIAGFKITLSGESYISSNKNVSALQDESVLASNVSLNFQQALQVCSNFVHANVRNK